jgi:hypothetical protein
VIGFRNWSTASRRWRSSSSKLNHNDKGSVRWHSAYGFVTGQALKITASRTGAARLAAVLKTQR